MHTARKFILNGKLTFFSLIFQPVSTEDPPYAGLMLIEVKKTSKQIKSVLSDFIHVLLQIVISL